MARVLEAAVDVERWPALLSHYRWVRRLERQGDGGLVEMAAWRPFGPVRYPTWWVSEMRVDRAAHAVHYRHVRGITTGMDVVWQIASVGEATDVTIVHEWTGPRWPLIGSAAAAWVIGPVFIHGIASRTLDRHPAGGGEGDMSEPRRVVVTGIGAITPIGLGVDGLWDGLRRRTLGGPLHHAVRSDHVQIADRRRGPGFRADGPHRGAPSPAARPVLPVHHCRHPHGVGRRGLDLKREDPDRVGAMMGTALGGVAHGEQNYHAFLTEGPRAVDPALALTVFAGAASCNIAIEFGCTGPNSTNGMSCASGAIAIGDGFRAIVRGDADVMITGGAEAPLAPLCFGAFAIIRAMSTRNDDPPTRAARSTRDVTASSWPRGRRCWCSKSAGEHWRVARRSTPRSAGSG